MSAEIVVGRKAVVLAVAATFVAGIGLSMATGIWKTESTKIPARYDSGAYAGEFDPADIRGSYSFADIESSFGIPSKELAKAFGLEYEGDSGAILAKSLEAWYGSTADGGEIGTDSLRVFVSLYTGRPYTGGENTRLPASSFEFLKDRVAPDELDFVLSIMADVTSSDVTSSDVASNDVAPDSSVPADAVHVPVSTGVRGSTTFADLLAWGLTGKEIEGVLGMKMGAAGMTVRDFAIANGKEFSLYKTEFQRILDSRNSAQ